MTVGTVDWAGAVAVKATTTLTTQTAQTIAGGATTTLGPFRADGTSYAMSLAPSMAASPTVGFTVVDIQVQDALGNIVDEVTYDIPMGVAAGDNVYVFQGPLAANYIQVKVTNQDTVTETYTLILYSNNINRLSHTVTTVKFTSVIAGKTIPFNCNPRKGIIHSTYLVNIPASGNQDWIYPPSPGPITLTFRIDFPAPFPISVAPLMSENNYIGLAQGNIVAMVTDANGNISTTVNFPRTAMQVRVHNGGGGVQNVSITSVFDCTSG